MTTAAPNQQQPDHFVYAIHDFPLHLEPYKPENTSKEKADRKEQKRTREFFRFIRTQNIDELKHDMIMHNGVKCGTAGLHHIVNQYKRRGTKTRKQNGKEQGEEEEE